jgi:uncharacterized protein YprB with RNaseH-like and TPR domain
MLQHSFCHIPGIGLKSERKLWRHGIHRWEDWLACEASVLSEAKRALARQSLEESKQALARRDAEHFAMALPVGEQWRLFPDFRDSVAYVDIETTGLGFGEDAITSIALYDGHQVRTYVQGRNLEAFEQDIASYDLLVTFNGKCFDVPFLERHFRTRLTKAHIDLRYVLRQIGYRGGLKACEKMLGLGRDELDGVDGYFAVLLWKEYQDTGDERFLETLLAYNVADVLSLEALLVHACNARLEDTPFYALHALESPVAPANPHRAQAAVIEHIRKRYGLYG